MERSYCAVEGPDILRWHMVGRVTVDDVHRLFDEQSAFCKGKSGFYVIVDMSRMQHVDSEARRAAARAPQVDGKPMPILAIAILGGSFHMRLLGRMINKAAAVLNRIPEIPVEFFDHVDAARQWITKHQRL